MITKLRPLQSFLLAFALTASAFAQQPTTSPSLDRLRKDVTHLASDALDGRRTGTQGANDAAQHIASEFSLLGLRPGMQTAKAARTRGARYLQSFPYVSGVELGKNNLLSTRLSPDSTIDYRVNEEWMPLGFSTNGSIKDAEVIFAGYGISSSGLKYDDYAVSNVKDRVAVVFAGTPDGDNPHSQFLQAGQIRFKAAAARAAGARGLLIIANEAKLSDDKLARLSYDNAGEAGIPVIVISRQLAALLLGGDLARFSEIADARLAVPKPAQPAGTEGLSNPINPAQIVRLPNPRLKLSLSTDVVRRESPSHNVIGILPGSDPKLKDEAIVIGAHYDHLGRGGAGSLAQSEGEIHHGADDNASGTAGLLELARMFSTQRPKPRRTIVFIAFSGEEEGLLGSNYYVNHPVVPVANTVAMINLDMVGRLNNQKLVIGGVGTASEWRSMIEAGNSLRETAHLLNGRSSSSKESSNGQAHVLTSNASTLLPLDPTKNFVLTLNEDGYGPSDHSSFYAKQIPVLFFWTGTHVDYHKPSDTAEKINYDGLARITSFVANIVRDIDKSDTRPTYKVAQVQATARSTGFRVYLGTIPNYADSSDGMLLDGVRDGSPAAKAGLKAGDKIVKMAGKDVKNVYDYTHALSEMKGGEEYEVEIVRAGQRMTLKLTPEKR
ncbi:MAG TPA: M20/M25/M40 family metallo-hydrolase [Pyrinomonadaceae bacterium]